MREVLKEAEVDEAVLDELERTVMAYDPERGFGGPQPVSTQLEGLADDLVDLVTERRFTDAEPLYRRLQRILDHFVAFRGLSIEHTDGCVAGQLRAFATVMGAIAQRMPQSFDGLARRQLRAPTYQPLYEALLTGEATTTTLARLTSEQKETVSRKLGILRNLGLVISYSLGRNVYSEFSSAAREIYEQVRDAPRGKRKQRPNAGAFKFRPAWQETGTQILEGKAGTTGQNAAESRPELSEETLRLFANASTMQNGLGWELPLREAA